AFGTGSLLAWRALHPAGGGQHPVAAALLVGVPKELPGPNASRSVLSGLGGSRPGRWLQRRWGTNPVMARRVQLAGVGSSRDLAGRVLAAGAVGAVACFGA